MRKASKLSEVAKIAGVSPITASPAIRGVGYVSESARARIMAAAAQLNYTPDLLARRMRGDKSKLIGVFVNNYGSLVLHEITKAISTEARRRGFDILLFNAERFGRSGRMETCDMLSQLWRLAQSMRSTRAALASGLELLRRNAASDTTTSARPPITGTWLTAEQRPILGMQVEVAGLRYTPRQGAAGVIGRIKQYRVYVGDQLVSEN